MLETLKRWVSRGSMSDSGHERVLRWGRSRGLDARAEAATDGVSLSGAREDGAAVVEWGAPQRPYIQGREWRWRAELPLPPTFQALVLDRPLQARMEREVFEAYVQDLHTRVDTRTPPEMRWLVMLQKVPPGASGGWAATHVAVASDLEWAQRWLSGPLSDALIRVAQALPSGAAQGGRAVPGSGVVPGEGAPFVLMLSRSRLTLRAQLPVPNEAAMDALYEVAQAAAARAVEVSGA